jgi:transposase
VAGLSWPIPDEIDDAALERRLFPPADAGSSAPRTDPDWSHIHTEMKRRGVTLALLWQEYRGEHPHGYAYSWFCERYGDWRKRITPTMRQTHVAGEKLFVDWAGDAIPVFDPITGAEHGARIFVAVLGASNYTYAEACWTETLPDWIGLHVNALSAIGSVPKAAVCDNIKAGITKHSRYEPGINRTCQDLADHYGFVVLPTRVRKPRRAVRAGHAAEPTLLLARRAECGSPRMRCHDQRQGTVSPGTERECARQPPSAPDLTSNRTHELMKLSMGSRYPPSPNCCPRSTGFTVCLQMECLSAITGIRSMLGKAAGPAWSAVCVLAPHRSSRPVARLSKCRPALQIRPLPR